MTQAESYCIGRVEGGYGDDRRCNTRIPASEIYCEDCKRAKAQVPVVAEKEK